MEMCLLFMRSGLVGPVYSCWIFSTAVAWFPWFSFACALSILSSYMKQLWSTIFTFAHTMHFHGVFCFSEDLASFNKNTERYMKRFQTVLNQGHIWSRWKDWLRDHQIPYYRNCFINTNLACNTVQKYYSDSCIVFTVFADLVCHFNGYTP